MTMFDEAKALLGKPVTDKVSGIVGTVTTATLHSNGMVQSGVQPRGDGKTLPDSWNIDARMLDIDPNGVVIEPLAPATDHHPLGGKAKSILSGVTGKLGEVSLQLNGCWVYGLVGQVNAEGKFATYSVLHENVELIGEPVATPIPEKRTGGPSTKAIRI